jgi:hypothetical protein
MPEEVPPKIDLRLFRLDLEDIKKVTYLINKKEY